MQSKCDTNSSRAKFIQKFHLTVLDILSFQWLEKSSCRILILHLSKNVVYVINDHIKRMIDTKRCQHQNHINLIRILSTGPVSVKTPKWRFSVNTGTTPIMSRFPAGRRIPPLARQSEIYPRGVIFTVQPDKRSPWYLPQLNGCGTLPAVRYPVGTSLARFTDKERARRSVRKTGKRNAR